MRGQDRTSRRWPPRAFAQKFGIENGESLHDHELIEHLLAIFISHRNTKQIAEDLLHRYGSLAALINADAGSMSQEK